MNACSFYNATLAIDVVGIAKYVSMPQAGVKEGLIRVPLGWSGKALHPPTRQCLGW